MEPPRQSPREVPAPTPLPLTRNAPERSPGRRSARVLPAKSPILATSNPRIRMQSDHPYSVAIADLCRSTLAVLIAFEHVQRHLHPSKHTHLRGLLERPGADLGLALTAF